MLSPTQLALLLAHKSGGAQPFVAGGFGVTTRVLIERGFLRFEQGRRYTRLTSAGRAFLDRLPAAPQSQAV